MNEHSETLKQINPVNSFGPEQFRQLIAATRTQTFTEGDCIYCQGDEDDQTHFLVGGSVVRESEGKTPRPLTVGDPGALYPMGNLQPRPHTAKVGNGGAVVVSADRNLVEDLATRSQLVSCEMPALSVTDVADAQGIDGSWMFQIVQSEIFRDLPTENIERFFSSVERVEIAQGQEVVRQGAEGDFYYMIVEGEAQVSRMAGPHPIPIASLGPGDSFGEEALISGLPRNASVKMTSAGVVMRLSKDRFESLLIKPVVQSIPPRDAARRIKADEADLIDVRLDNEHGSRNIRGCTNIPLFRLRDAIDNLDASRSYITYCDCGARSSAAAFLLSQHGLEASFIEGGMSAMLGQQ
ncbi:MAG: cyclic nucleotide-binding domain-containing protein [Lysobacterales bacterium]